MSDGRTTDDWDDASTLRFEDTATDPLEDVTIPYLAAGETSEPSAESFPSIGGYRIVRKLGAGGMGAVYEAEQESLERRVAIKLLPPHRRLDDRAVSQFRREAMAGGRQRHPNIVAIHDVGVDDGAHFIVQELVEGGRTLADVIEEHRERSRVPKQYYRDIARLFVRIAMALHDAHEAGVIHRDLKPPNILITPDGRPKVGDFGLARVEDSLALSRTGDVSGTPYYMSPEQVMGLGGSIDRRSDVFSLGATLYEALTFTKAFAGDASVQVFHKVMKVDPPHPQQLRSHVPTDLASICLMAMEKKPEHRYPTMADFAADLTRFLEDEPIVASPPGIVRRGVKWARRHPVMAVSGSVLTVALVVVSGLSWELSQTNAVLTAEIATTRAALDFLEGLFESADPWETGGETPTVKHVLDRGRDRIGDEFVEQPGIRARMQSTLGSVYVVLGEYDAADELLEGALVTRRELHGDDHADTLTSMHQVGLLYHRTARDDDALPLVQQGLEGRRRLLGDDSEFTLATINLLAGILKDLGRLEESETLYIEALDGRRRVLGEEHLETLEAMHNLAMVYTKRGRVEEAAAIREEHAETCIRALGADHPGTLYARAGLALVYFRLGRYEESAVIYRDTLERRRRVLGDDHPDTWKALRGLATTLSALGRQEEATQLLRDARDDLAATLGPDDPKTLYATNALAAHHRDRGHLREAELAYKEALEGRLRTLGEDHRDTLTSYGNVAYMCWKQERYADALQYYQRAMHGRARVFGPDHPKTLGSQFAVGRMLTELGRHEEAEPLLREVLVRRREQLGPDASRTLNVQAGLAGCLVELGQLEEAESLLVDSLRRGLEEPSREKAEELLATIRSSQGAGSALVPSSSP